MKILTAKKLNDWDDLLIVPVCIEGKVVGVDLGKVYAIACGDFSGKAGEVQLVYVGGKRVILAGMGDDEWKKGYGAALCLALQKKVGKVVVVAPEMEMAGAAVEIALHTNYAYDMNLSEKKHRFAQVTVVTDDEFSDVAKLYEKIYCGVDLCRDLTNGSADDVTPDVLAETAKALGEMYPKLKVTVHTSDKFPLIHAVGRGSEHPSYLIEMQYEGGKGAPIAIASKGITFDTGGMSLKPSNGMLEMRGDMGGAGILLGTMKALCELELPIHVVGLVATAENAIDGKSYKIGDVYKSYSGKSVEIVNTDAEGRLVLADAVAYATRELKPKEMIDIATLTGSVVMALGDHRAGVYTKEKEISDTFFEVGEEINEKVWPMPMDDFYATKLKSTIADLAHLNLDRKAGSVVAAKFIEKFVENDTPWVHLDVAGVTFLKKPSGIHRSHVTGYGVKLLLRYLEKAHASH